MKVVHGVCTCSKPDKYFSIVWGYSFCGKCKKEVLVNPNKLDATRKTGGFKEMTCRLCGRDLMERKRGRDSFLVCINPDCLEYGYGEKSE